MMHRAVRTTVVLFLASAALAWSAWPAQAVQRERVPAQRPAAAAPQGPSASTAAEQSAEETREELTRIFLNYPPALAGVLKLDPSLMSNEAYLAPYPQLAGFLARHPEILRNPAYYLEHLRTQNHVDYDPRRAVRDDIVGVLAGLAVFLAFLVMVSVAVWLIRLTVAHRRWNRVSKVQFETHSKLLDRFTSNDELLAYVQTPAGRRFLEAAPIQEAAPAIAAPPSRILWSVQAGVVLSVLAIGLLQVSRRFTDELSQVFLVAGILFLALGAGFVVSAVAAYGLSRRLGLLERPAADHA